MDVATAAHPTSALAELGARRVVNARGIYTDLGGSILAPRVWAAMEESNRYFADLPELLERTGDAIARLLGAEAARVTPGAAAAITLGTAACLAGKDPVAIGRLPEAAGLLEDRVVMQARHRYKYDRCVRTAGARLVEAGDGNGTTLDQLDATLAQGAAAVCLPAHLDGARGTVSLDETCRLARARSVPVLADTAYLVDPPDRMRALAGSGADLLCFSAKYFGGPNAGGFLCGRRDLVEAVAALDFIRFEAGEQHRYGRPFKLDRQTVVAVYAALREWLDADHRARFAAYERKVELLRRRLEGNGSLVLEPMCFTMEETLVPAPVNCLRIRVDPASGRTASEVDTALRAGDPSVYAHVVEEALVVVVETVPDEHEELLAERLEQALS